MSASIPDDLPGPGAILAGKYEIVRALGSGGMGLVFEARHLRLNQGVAIKLLRPEVRAIAEVTVRFEREGRACARLQSPHVARVLDVDVLPDGSPFMVMELLRGRELGNELTVRGPLPIREAVGYVLQACTGMEEAHRAGIVHRDLKPSNLFITELDGRRVVKVLDFGISKLAEDVQSSVTTTASAFGTPLYMSPEQVRSVKHVDARTDLWSLGVVLYELLVGEPPFIHDSATAILAAIIADKPKPVRERRPELPAGLAAVVMKALEKNPAARFGSARELAAALAPFGPSKDDPVQIDAVTEMLASPGQAPTIYAITGQDFGAEAQSSRRTWVLVAGGATLLAGLVAAAFVLASRPPSGNVAPIPEAAPSALVTAIPTSSAPLIEPARPPEASAALPPPTASVIAPSAVGSAKHKSPPPGETAPKVTPKPPESDPKYL
ncbi:MAG: protein kinase [Minicystis sp.]